MRRLVERARPPRLALRSRLAVALPLAAALVVTSACGQDGQEHDAGHGATGATATPTPTDTSTAEARTNATPTATTTPTRATPSPTATTAPSPQTLAAPAARGPVGTWRNRELRWVLRLRKGGRFTEDFDGVRNVRTGRWKRSGNVVVLKGGDGITTRGRLKADTLTIRGTVLTRVR